MSRKMTHQSSEWLASGTEGGKLFQVLSRHMKG